MVRCILPVSLRALDTALTHWPHSGIAQAGAPQSCTQLPQAAGEDPAACQQMLLCFRSPPSHPSTQTLKSFADDSRHGLLAVGHVTAQSWKAQAQKQTESKPGTFRMRERRGEEEQRLPQTVCPGSSEPQARMTPPNNIPAMGMQVSNSAVQAPRHWKRRSGLPTQVLPS